MTPSQLDQPTIGSLIGMLAVLEGSARTGDLPLDQGLWLRRRLVEAGTLSAGEPYTAFADSLAELNQRVRTLEDPSGGGHPQLPVENVVALPDAASAEEFLAEMRALGRDVDQPVHEAAYHRWTVVIRYAPGTEAPVGIDARAAVERGGWHLGAQ